MTRYHFVLMLTVAVSGGLSSRASADVRYTITDLGLGFAYAINDAGQVAGDREGLGFLWENGLATDLLPGQDVRAFDINESTQVVGWVFNDAYLWDAGEVTTLGTFGGVAAQARGINDFGQVVGWAHDVANQNRAFLYDGGALTDLGTFGGQQSWAFGINNAGQVVGEAETDVTPPGGLPIRRAFLYTDGTMTPIAGDYSQALDINDAGQVIGSDVNGPFFWDNGVLTTLDTLGGFSEPRAINNLGQVVGFSFPGALDRAFLWEDGVTHDLNDLIPPGSGWQRLQQAQDINDLGQIVGWGHRTDDVSRHAFLLTPIPEPNGLLLAAMGSLVLLKRTRG